jgi:hypothetical protein
MRDDCLQYSGSSDAERRPAWHRLGRRTKPCCDVTQAQTVGCGSNLPHSEPAVLAHAPAGFSARQSGRK